jgi:membrane protein required for colicin V production
MNGFDIAVLVVAGVVALIGLLKGAVRILVGIAALIVAFLLASRFHQPLADLCAAQPGRWLRVGAYVAIFLGIMLVGGWVAWRLRALFRAAMLGWADRMAGAALGLAAAALGTALLIMPLVAYAPDGESVLARSRLAPYLVVVSGLFDRFVPEELRRHYRGGVEQLRTLWGRGADRI